MENIYTSKPVITQEMKDEVSRVLSEEMLVGGKSVELFEEEFAEYIGSKYAVAVNSGTDALVIAQRILNPEGCEVLTTPMSFVATAESVVLSGGHLDFADIYPYSGNLSLSPDKIEESKYKVVIPVHLYGHPCSMDKVMKLSDEFKFSVIEDAAQAHGASYKGKKVGSFGEAGCFSFYSTKNMTVGGNGGMIVTDNENICKKARLLREHGGGNNAQMVGYNARMSTIQAAIGRIQLRYLNQWNIERRKIANIYRKELQGCSDIHLPPDVDGHVYHLFVITTKYRDSLKDYLASKHIYCGIHYPVPLHKLPVYKKEVYLPFAELHAAHCLSLPMYPTLLKEEVLEICDWIKIFFEDVKK